MWFRTMGVEEKYNVWGEMYAYILRTANTREECSGGGGYFSSLEHSCNC